MKTTKILCTLGPSSFNDNVIRRLTELGVDLFRLNLSHTPVERLPELVELVRSHSDVPVCFDSQGAQVRTGMLRDGSMALEPGSVVSLVSVPESDGALQVPLYPPEVIPQLRVGDLVSMDFDTALLQVIEVGDASRARVLSGGTVGSNKAVSIIDHTPTLPSLTAADRAAFALCPQLGIRHVALSFANRREDVEELRSLVGPDVDIISKIESRSGLQHLDDILSVSDAILVDRGDLSREVPLESIPYVQKDVIRSANQANVPVYVATNLLESMIENARPTRAEVNDVVNTLADGADGLVLAAETAIGQHPVACASMIKTLVQRFESRMEPIANHLIAHSRLVSPHGGDLVERVMNAGEEASLQGLPTIEIDEHTAMDVMQIGVGAFSPLQGFMGAEDLESVLSEYRLANGTVWPMPILLQLPEALDDLPAQCDRLILRREGDPFACLSDVHSFSYDLERLAQKWFGTSDVKHPGVARLLMGSDRFLSGKADLLSEAFVTRKPYELTPTQSRLIFQHHQWQRVVGFHTRNVPHRVHEYLQFTAMERYDCDGLFIHPVIGPKKAGDFEGEIILRAYEHLVREHYPRNRVVLGGFATYSRYSGPREAVFTAICRKNFGCSHFIVGRDHTGVGDFYPADGARVLFEKLGDIGIVPVFFGEVSHCSACRGYVETCEHGATHSKKISGTQAREALRAGETLPDWFVRESVGKLLAAQHGELFVGADG